jgi:uncharacterized protein
MANQWLEKEEYHSVFDFYKENDHWIGHAILLPIPFAFLSWVYKRKMRSVRTHPRACHNCGKQMTRLDEAAEDAYLSKEKQFEENLNAIDYDVWKCSACQSVSFEQYISEKTEYTLCSNCNTHALYIENDSILSEATTTSAGEKEIINVCKFCGHRDRILMSLPIIDTSPDSFGDSSSSSSSSNSGGSWGGGDSGGGGSSSSW